MTDDTTSNTTVSDDEIGSWEDRYERGSALALSHPPFLTDIAGAARDVRAPV